MTTKTLLASLLLLTAVGMVGGCGEGKETCICTCTCGTGAKSTLDDTEDEEDCSDRCSATCAQDYTTNYDCRTES